MAAQQLPTVLPGDKLQWREQIDALVASREYPAWLVKILAAEKPVVDLGRERITALSGGKDSTAMALAQAYFEPGSYRYVITPTGDELPDMVAHWDLCAAMLGTPLEVVGTRTLFGLCLELEAIPNHRARWCTRKIKLEPYYKWLATLGPVTSHVGLRADEGDRPGMVFVSAGGIQMDFPMQRWGWTLEDVLSFLDFLGVAVPDRSDCAVCFWQKLGEWYLLWRDHRERFNRGVFIEDHVTAIRGKAHTFRSEQRDSWPASLRELGAEFEKGRIPTRSLAIMDRRRAVGSCRVCTL